MQRDIATLKAAAAKVEADLRRTDLDVWRCTVDESYQLIVSDGERSLAEALSAEVEDPQWYAPPGVSADELHRLLDLDAAETVGEATVQLLRGFGVAWPACPGDGHDLACCGGEWFCHTCNSSAHVGELDDETFYQPPPTLTLRPEAAQP